MKRASQALRHTREALTTTTFIGGRMAATDVTTQTMRINPRLEFAIREVLNDHADTQTLVRKALHEASVIDPVIHILLHCERRQAEEIVRLFPGRSPNRFHGNYD